MILPAHVEAGILAHAREATPAECCGLLIGNKERIAAAKRATNAADDPERRYLVDPREHFDAIREARRGGLEVIGVYHSHPTSTARPSPTDAAEAFGGFVFLIVGLGPMTPEVAAWQWVDGNFVGLPLVRLQ